MPGVPTGRGCDGCRKQKKKCDQASPSCSRCSRLKVACVGAGQRRYKFLDGQSRAAKPPQKISKADATSLNFPLSYSPSNELTVTTRRLCAALDIKDVRYDLSVFGEFMRDIPKRLGTNSALDASMKALTSSFHCVLSKEPSVEAIEHYVSSLKALRICLNDPAKAMSPNTLCAIYIHAVLQGWMDRRGESSSHFGAIAHLLSLAAYHDRQDVFESELVVTLCIPAIFDAVANPKIKLFPWLPKLTEAHDQTISMESMKIRNLAKLPQFISHPEAHLLEIQLAYRQLQIDIPYAQGTLKVLASMPECKTMYSRYQTVAGMLLSYALIYKVLLRSLGHDTSTSSSECTLYIEHFIELAEDARQFLPLGSSAMPLYGSIAWIAAQDSTSRSKIEGLMLDYQNSDMLRWMHGTCWLRDRLVRTCGTQPQALVRPPNIPSTVIFSPSL